MGEDGGLAPADRSTQSLSHRSACCPVLGQGLRREQDCLHTALIERGLPLLDSSN